MAAVMPWNPEFNYEWAEMFAKRKAAERNVIMLVMRLKNKPDFNAFNVHAKGEYNNWTMHDQNKYDIIATVYPNGEVHH